MPEALNRLDTIASHLRGRYYFVMAMGVGFWSSFEYIFSRVAARSLKYTRHFREGVKAHFLEDFTYTTLSRPSAIRLLSIAPGTIDEPIRCSMEEVSLDDFPIYNALSYSWKRDIPWKFWVILILLGPFWSLNELCTRVFGHGLPNPVDIIQMDEKKVFWISVNDRRMKVHTNLYNFLLQLRQSCSKERFWIDAICIDQSSVPERNIQVKLMARIYKSSQRLVAWLGPCPSLLDSELIMGRASSPYRTSIFEGLSTSNAWLHNAIIGWRAPVIVARLFLTTLARAHLLSRSFFKRTWIIQEVLLPSHVTFWIGRHKMEPKQLLEVVDLFEAQSINACEAQLFSFLFFLMSPGAVRRLIEERRRFQQDQNWSLADYIMVANEHKVTEIRDLVFAGLGLIAKPPSNSVCMDFENSTTSVFSNYDHNCLSHPDYSASLITIFTNCTEQLLHEVGLFALSLACDGRRWGQLPSWIPHFEMKTEPFKNEIGLGFSAGGDRIARAKIADNKRVLYIESGAEHLDYIESTYKFVDAKTLMEIIVSLPDMYESTGETIILAIARTLVADRLSRQVPAPASVATDLVTFLNTARRNESNQVKSQMAFLQVPLLGRIFGLMSGLITGPKEIHAETGKKIDKSNRVFDASLAKCQLISASNDMLPAAS